ncbi:MAG: hypothetical protein K2W95_15490 [Candidatus Obscuribacterales bacterium]|nr:hypothetical protein [Candidatus Obscuribacterales bacterium]
MQLNIKQKVTLVGGVCHGRQMEVDRLSDKINIVTNPRSGAVDVWVIDWQTKKAHFDPSQSGNVLDRLKGDSK